MQRRHARLGWIRNAITAVGLALATASAAGAEGGRLVILGEGGARGPAPTVATDIEVEITGPVARVQVVQRFRNPGDAWVEAIYEFPLPEKAAVDTLRMVVGRRIVEGQIREKTQARVEYQEAARQGKRASLVEQKRPDVFTTSLANVGPREEIEIAIEYQQTLDYRDGRFSLRLPLTVAPRYGDGSPAPTARWSGPAGAAFGTVVAGAFAPGAFSAGRSGAPAVAPVEIRVDLDAGMPLREVVSPSHAVHVSRGVGESYAVELAETAPADCDFTLEWEPEAGHVPHAAFWVEPHGAHLYGLLMVVPPRHPDAGHRLDREVVFVIDTSGSMNGPSIEQARRALLWALERLDSRDRFNVIEFNSRHTQLFPEPVAASAQRREQARRWVSKLSAGGGTDMAPALAAALTDAGAPVDVRQVVFITDGAVGNETLLFAAIQAELGRSRLFTVGIGSAPNGHFMRKAAQWGRGSFTFVQGLDEVATRMEALFAQLEKPVLKDLEMHWSHDDAVEAWPPRLPDLYWGEPLVLAARLPDLGGELQVDGWQGDAPWGFEVGVEADAFATGVHQLWARRKIESLLDSVLEGADPEAVREEVVALGIEHHLVTRHTSLVAVDVTPTAPPDANVEARRVPSLLPAGWQGTRLPSTATASSVLRLLGAIGLGAGAWLRRRSSSRRAHIDPGVHPRHGASGGGGRP